MRDWRCTRCGTRASSLSSCYETCKVGGPFHDWEETSEDGPISDDDSTSLRHTGMVRQEYERLMCGCPLCLPGTGPVDT